jgi:hypothetical protein
MGTAAALILAACATGNVMATTAAAGTRFSGKGKLTFHRGEPCTSQIMYDFHPADSRAVVWLAAGAHESKKLAEAIQQRRGVRVTGIWQRGQHPGCAYVDVKKLTVERTWWNKLWNP